MAAATDQSPWRLTSVNAVQMNDYLYSVYFQQHYSVEQESTIWSTIRPEYK